MPIMEEVVVDGPECIAACASRVRASTLSKLNIYFDHWTGCVVLRVHGLRPDIAQAYADAINGVTERMVQLAEHPII